MTSCLGVIKRPFFKLRDTPVHIIYLVTLYNYIHNNGAFIWQNISFFKVDLVPYDKKNLTFMLPYYLID